MNTHKALALEISSGVWWRLTRNMVRPYCTGNPSIHRRLRRRFRQSWPLLVERTWTPFLHRALTKRIHEHDADGPDCYPRGLALLFEVAYVWAEERESEVNQGDTVRAAAKELTRLDAELFDCLGRLGDVLHARTALRDQHGITSVWERPGLDLWDALEEAGRNHSAWSAVVHRDLEAFLRLARGQSRPGPELVDLIEAVASSSHVSEPLAERADDRASLTMPSGSSYNSPAEALRRFMAQVDESFRYFNDDEDHVALRMLTDAGVSALLTVASGGDADDPTAFTVEMVKKQRGRYLKGSGR